MATVTKSASTAGLAPTGGHEADEEPVLSPLERAARELRRSGENAQITDLGASSAGINLNLDDEDRRRLLNDFSQALHQLGFK